MKRRSNNGYGRTTERADYTRRHSSRFLPIVDGIIQIGKHQGKHWRTVQRDHHSYFIWACAKIEDFEALATD